ncbi:hypothetical protein TNCV_2438731 [Trichonephila clavipes]|nr:hypothetical protein TNCV_2438731 [Trichonephila clavipes]
MDIHPETQLAQETATQKFADYPDHLVRAAVLEAVHRNGIAWYEEFETIPNELHFPMPLHWIVLNLAARCPVRSHPIDSQLD